MRQIRFFAVAVMVVTGLATPAAAGTISSVYTDFDLDKDCTKYAAATGDDGDWADFVCDGYRGYPVLLFYGDLRESLFYGFPPALDPAPARESFAAFNHSGPKIEWRLEANGDAAIPFATIHRWFVSDPEDAQRETEVLVVEKVGQPDKRDGCAVGYVVASGNPRANQEARQIADEKARGFTCGRDRPIEAVGSVKLPDHVRWQN